MAKLCFASSFLLLHLLIILLPTIHKPIAYAECTPPPCQGKQSWPELIGKEPKTAYNCIRHDNPQVNNITFLISDALRPRADNGMCCNHVLLVIGNIPSRGDGIIKVPHVG
uniref:Uncharacterized protein n=1 Tax=Hordeum vulgare subsp. vulgare TaxID=112509 RepID=A0A8I6XHD7_HORVV